MSDQEKKREGLSLIDWQFQVQSDLLDHADSRVAIAMILTPDKTSTRGKWLTTITAMRALDYATAAGILIRSAIDQLDDDKKLGPTQREVIRRQLRTAAATLPIPDPEQKEGGAR
jgi:hypothetical protein